MSPLTALKTRLRPTTQWLAVALRAPQEEIQVKLITPGHEFDVTGNTVIAALRPLTMALGTDPEMRAALDDTAEPQLHWIDRGSGRTLGRLALSKTGTWDTAGALLYLFEVRWGAHDCASWPRKALNTWRYTLAARKNKRPGNFAMVPPALEQMLIFYLCPRPVYLVSVDDGQRSNLFPMDLVGPIAPSHFTLALRSTSASIETMKSDRRVALSSVAAADCGIAYKLGAHHKNPQVDWDALPFKVRPSRGFSLQVPVIGLHVRELQILDFQTVGSHTFFMCRIVSEEHVRDGTQLFHTCGIHQYFRTRNGRGLELANAAPAAPPTQPSSAGETNSAPATDK